MSLKEKDTEEYLEKVESDEGEFDAIFKDLNDETDLMLLSTNKDGNPKFRIIDYAPFHRRDRKIVQQLSRETDYEWVEWGFSKRGSVTESGHETVYRPGVRVSEDAYVDQVEQFAYAVFGEDYLDDFAEIGEM